MDSHVDLEYADLACLAKVVAIVRSVTVATYQLHDNHHPTWAIASSPQITSAFFDRDVSQVLPAIDRCQVMACNEWARVFTQLRLEHGKVATTRANVLSLTGGKPSPTHFSGVKPRLLQPFCLSQHFF